MFVAALLDHLWDKLIAMGWLGTPLLPEIASAARQKAQKAISVVSKKRPLLAVESVREMVLQAIDNVLQTPNLTKEKLREGLELLQRDAIQQGAAFLLSKAAGVDLPPAEEALKSLLRSNPLVGSDTVRLSQQEREEKHSMHASPNLQAWLVQAYFIADPVLLLSRPSIFTPCVTLLEVLHQITRKAQDITFLRRSPHVRSQFLWVSFCFVRQNVPTHTTI